MVSYVTLDMSLDLLEPLFLDLSNRAAVDQRQPCVYGAQLDCGAW